MRRQRTPGFVFALAFGCNVIGCQGGDDNSQIAWAGKAKADPVEADKIAVAPEPEISARTHLAAGKMLERQNNIDGAVEQYQLAIGGDPALVDAYNRLGVIHLKRGSFGDAEAILERGVRAVPDSASLRNNLGYCYLQQNRFAEAEQALRAVLSLAPGFERARMNLAVALARMRRLGESAVEFSRVLPGEAAFFNVAVVCMEMKDYSLAAAALEKALIVDPEYGPAKAQFEQIGQAFAARNEQAESDSPSPDAAPLEAGASRPDARLTEIVAGGVEE